MTSLNVVELKRPDYFDTVKALRNLADDIEKGEYGEVLTCAVAISSQEGGSYFGSGPVSDFATIYLTFGRAMAAMANGIVEG